MESNFLIIIESICTSKPSKKDDWITIANIVKSSEEKGKESMNNLKDLLTNESSVDKLIVILDVIDYLMDVSPLFFKIQLSTKTFMTSMLMLLKRGKEYQGIQLKVLYLIQKWAKAFESKTDLVPNFNETYKALVKSECVFPSNMSSDYEKYINDNKALSKQQTVLRNDHIIESKSKEVVKSGNYNNNNRIKSYKNNYGNVCLDLNPDHYPRQLHLFVSELPALLENVILDNEMIDNFDHTKSNIDEGIIELTQNIQDIYVSFKKTIETKITHEKLIGICLGILEDIEKLFERYNSLIRHQKPKQFISCFLNEYSSYDLNKKNINHIKPLEKISNKNNNDNSDSESGEDEEGEDEEDDDDNPDELIK